LNTYIEAISSRIVGTVEFVAPNEFRVVLDSDAPQTTALNATVPQGFPRLNGFVLIPNEVGAIVAVVTWIGIERSYIPKASVHKDLSLIDLPFPVRKMVVTPLGTLQQDIQNTDSVRFVNRFSRGVSVFPSVGDKVVLPTSEQLRSIIEGQGGFNGVVIGRSSFSGDAEVAVDPDKIFGRHLAVLGNTGSGKSCTVAGLIHWTLEHAQKVRQERRGDGSVNARFIVLDPNGEYGTAFKSWGARVFRVGDEKEGLLVPAWFWNVQEWVAFTGAKPGVQRPLLLQALRELKQGGASIASEEQSIRRVFTFYHQKLLSIIEMPSNYMDFPGKKETGQLLENIAQTCKDYAPEMQPDFADIAARIAELCEKIVEARKDRAGYFGPFLRSELEQVSMELQELVNKFGEETPLRATIDANVPRPFNVDFLPDYLEELSRFESASNVGHVQNLSMRIRTLLADSKLRSIICPNTEIKFEDWLDLYVGSNDGTNGPITVLDLSLVPSNVVHLVTAVVARIIFEAVQRYRRHEKGNVLPTVLVLEEAHTFIKRFREKDEDDGIDAADVCREVFERIAREGRKFGLGLVISSQRPSELSPTVLSQCNTFLLHRLVNDRDQELVARLIPDNLGGLLNELPSLPTGETILLGWAAPIPLQVTMKRLSPEQRPQSDDPKFWDVWIGDQERELEWKNITSEWMKNG
jgi:DNA helicase HerA-like ATPase